MSKLAPGETEGQYSQIIPQRGYERDFMQEGLDKSTPSIIMMPGKETMEKVATDSQHEEIVEQKKAPSPSKARSDIANQRLLVMRKNYEKRITEKWRKALKHLGINENLYPTRKADLLEQYSPFTDASIAKIKEGLFAER